MKRKNRIHRFDNGLVFLAEVMDWADSVAYTLSVPAGFIHEQPELFGLSGLVCEMIMRGAGPYDSRSLLEAYEEIGCEHSEGAGRRYTSYSAAMLPENLFESLDILAETVLRPRFPIDQLAAARALSVQEVLALDDEPARKLMIVLGENFFKDPWGRSGIGTLETLNAIEISHIEEYFERFYRPNGAVFSIAGNIDPDAIIAKLETIFGSWQEKEEPVITETPGGKDRIHIPHDSEQTHIGIAYPSLPFGAPDYLCALSGCSVLSEGMSSRLFTELREKRGLCYSVYANYITMKDIGAIVCYCASATEQASESVALLFEELERLSAGITEAELARVKIRAKTSLVMQQESTGSRSSLIARDWTYLGRIRTMEEIESSVNALELDRVNRYLSENPAGPFHIATLGRENPV